MRSRVATRVALARGSARATTRARRPRAVDFRDDDRRSYGEWGVDGIAQNSLAMHAMSGAWESDARRAWREVGVDSETRVTRLLILGNRHRKDEVGEIFRDHHAIATMCEALERFCGEGVRAGEVFHKCPEAALVCVDAAKIQRALVNVRAALSMKEVCLGRVVERAPRCLLAAGDADAMKGLGDATRALAAAMDVSLDDERLRAVVESTAEVLFEEPGAIQRAIDEMKPLNDGLHHPSLADFVVEYAEALVVPYIRQTLAQTLAMRRSYRV